MNILSISSQSWCLQSRVNRKHLCHCKGKALTSYIYDMTPLFSEAGSALVPLENVWDKGVGKLGYKLANGLKGCGFLWPFLLVLIYGAFVVYLLKLCRVMFNIFYCVGFY